VKYRVFWPDAALAQVSAIYDYVAALASVDSAAKLGDDLLDSTRYLPDNPRLYPVFPDSPHGARHIVLRRNWRVLYVVDDAARCCTVVDVVSTRLPYEG
jgi:plasmid stabilization system protein ParE